MGFVSLLGRPSLGDCCFGDLPHLPGPRAIVTSFSDMRGDHPRPQRSLLRLQLRFSSLRLIAGRHLCVHRGIHLASEHADSQQKSLKPHV